MRQCDRCKKVGEDVMPAEVQRKKTLGQVRRPSLSRWNLCLDCFRALRADSQMERVRWYA